MSATGLSPFISTVGTRKLLLHFLSPAWILHSRIKRASLSRTEHAADGVVCEIQGRCWFGQGTSISSRGLPGRIHPPRFSAQQYSPHPWLWASGMSTSLSLSLSLLLVDGFCGRWATLGWDGGRLREMEWIRGWSGLSGKEECRICTNRTPKLKIFGFLMVVRQILGAGVHRERDDYGEGWRVRIRRRAARTSHWTPGHGHGPAQRAAVSHRVGPPRSGFTLDRWPDCGPAIRPGRDPPIRSRSQRHGFGRCSLSPPGPPRSAEHVTG